MVYTKKEMTKLSSFMCKLLRHSPKEYGLEIDEKGFCDVKALIETLKKQARWKEVSMELVEKIVKDCNKQRYELKDGKIRARYGHSVPVLQEKSERPLPKILYHGTNDKAISLILDSGEGIRNMGRQYVHLSESTDFAELAAKRRQSPQMLKVDTTKAIEKGVEFYYAGNEVWLSTNIPVECIEKINHFKK